MRVAMMNCNGQVMLLMMAWFEQIISAICLALRHYDIENFLSVVQNLMRPEGNIRPFMLHWVQQ